MIRDIPDRLIEAKPTRRDLKGQMTPHRSGSQQESLRMGFDQEASKKPPMEQHESMTDATKQPPITNKEDSKTRPRLMWMGCR